MLLADLGYSESALTSLPQRSPSDHHIDLGRTSIRPVMLVMRMLTRALSRMGGGGADGRRRAFGDIEWWRQGERSVGSCLVGLRGDAGVWRERRMEVASAWVDGCVEVSKMTETLHRPVVGSRERYPLAADAFLYAAMIYLVVGVLQQGIAYLLSGGDMGTWRPPVWLEAMGAQWEINQPPSLGACLTLMEEKPVLHR